MESSRPPTSWRIHGAAFLAVVVITSSAALTISSIGPHHLFGRSWVGEFHDKVLLPLVLERPLTDLKWLIYLAGGLSVLIVLWPHRSWYMLIALCASGFVLLWLCLYHMWYHRPVCFVALAVVLTYAGSRFYWSVVVRLVPILGRRIFVTLERVVEATYQIAENPTTEALKELPGPPTQASRRPLVELYFDAIRAVTLPAKSTRHKAPTLDLWDRSGLMPFESQGIWGRLFTALAAWYRTHRLESSGQFRVWPALGLTGARLLYGRVRPASLDTPWLEEILDATERRLFSQELEAQNDSNLWLRLFYRWVTSVELLIEYHLFDPPQLAENQTKLAWAIEKYDEISRVGLIAQVAAWNFCDEKSATNLWEEIGKTRAGAIRRCLQLRQYTGLSQLLPGSLESPEKLVERIRQFPPAYQSQALAYAIGLIQIDCYLHPTKDTRRLAQDVLALVIGLEHSTCRPTRALLWKVVELACDLHDFRIAQEILVRPKLRTDSELKPRAGLSLCRNSAVADLLEGHIAWFLATHVEDPAVRVQAYRHAFTAFCAAGMSHARRFYERLKHLTEGRKATPTAGY